MTERILVFIPTYRCEQQISRVLRQFDEETQKHFSAILVIDNISPDKTFEVAQSLGQKIFKIPFFAWQNHHNYGLGGSHKVALQYALEHGYDYLLVLHGDDQAQVKDILPWLQEKVLYDALLGSRFMRGSKLQGYSRFRTLGNKIYNSLFSAVLRRPVKDLGSGLNLYKVSALKNIQWMQFPDDLSFNYVLLLSQYFARQKIKYFPISWREEDQRSNVKLFQQAFRVLKMLVSFALSPSYFLKQDLRERPRLKYTSGPRTTIVIPMAGKGERFSAAGYTVPKHEIKVHGKTLFEWSLLSLSHFFERPYQLIFVSLAANNSKAFIAEECRKFGLKDWQVIELSTPTDGQATTALAARELWNGQDHLLIYNIDTHVDIHALHPDQIRPGSDGWVPTFQAPGDHWSFVKVGADSWATDLAEKNKISENASIGLYWFARAKDFETAYQEHFSKPENLVRGEKYVAPLYNHLIGNQAKISITDIPVEAVHVLGTPAELETFQSLYKI